MLKTTMLLAFLGAVSTGDCHAETRPLTDAEKKIIASTYGSDLKDPQSAQYQWPNLVVDPSVKGDEMGYCFRINAKNSYGGYTGFRTVTGTVKRSGGKIVSYRYAAGSRDDAIMNETVENVCQIMGYRF
ncbi:hypothetical protein CWS35_04820 [Bradyrhizobium sp. SK17]|nr:hypothetical protein CWS35_04820 [Bradyrhizobium sp. SK17]